ncbi:MAG: 5'-3' exonuclease H3TH domain-containing protein [Clostridium perfringens]|nr:5'-3' exonuclease H3TH domain-containing protein [Clostridium perfringens]MDU2323404.1 5'-3' exonuclease H3TH domain-containing protein [Clostridium perfringens]MDU3775765.1 5'-3' exonuclease H3TH domain-containing protein [Clostridium perfringens]
MWLVTSKCEDMASEMNIKLKECDIPQGVFEYNLESFCHFKGLNHPIDFIDAKALMGDKSDNIPGVNGVGEKAVMPLLKEYTNIETVYDNIEGLSSKEEKELKKFFKDSLGISRSPIANLLKEGTIHLASGDKLSYKCLSGDLTEEQIDVQEIVKNKIGELRFPIEITTKDGISMLQNGEVLGVEMSAKESAFMSKELATIKTDIPAIQNISLDDVKFNINQELLRERLLDLEIKSLI